MNDTLASYQYNNKTSSNSKAAHNVIADHDHPPESSAVAVASSTGLMDFQAHQPRQRFQDLLKKHKENFDMTLAKRAAHFKDVKAELHTAEWKERTDGIALDGQLALLKTKLEVLKNTESAKVAEVKEEIRRQREKNRWLKEKRTAGHDSLLIQRGFVGSVHGENTLPIVFDPPESADTTSSTLVWNQSVQLFSETKEDANNNNNHNNN